MLELTLALESLCLPVWVCFLLFASLFPLAKVWLGDLRVVVCGVVLVSALLLHRFAYSKDFLSLYRVLSAYSHVRTEP